MDKGLARRHINNKESLGLYDAICSPVWLFDLDRHNIWWANKAAVKFWRAENRADLLSRDFGTDSDMVRRRLRQVIEHTAPDEFSSETWTLYPMGHPVTVMLAMTPVTIDGDRRDAVVIEVQAPIHMDDDPQGLRMLEAMRYTSLIVSSFTLGGEFLSQNPAAADCYSDLAQKIGEEVADFVDRFEDVEAGRILLAAARAGAEASGEYRVRTRHGLRWHSMDLTLGRDPLSGETVIVVTEEDITRSHEMKQQLAELNRTLERRVKERTADLERANRTKSDFIAHMSHDLRTPLNAILGFSDIIRTGLLGDDVLRNRDYANSIHRAASQLLALINDLLDISRIESGQMVVNPRAVDLAELLEEACDLVCSSMPGEHPGCEISIEEGLNSFVTDPRVMHQILVNLISNAAKYTPASGQVTLGIGTGGKPGQLEVTVADTGRGISADVIDRIFEAYERGNPQLASSQEGTGLGLAIVKGLVRLLDGRISIDSVEGEGTTVTVTVPEMQGDLLTRVTPVGNVASKAGVMQPSAPLP